MPLFETVTDPVAQAAVLKRRRYGVIEIENEKLVRIRLRPLPKFATILASQFWGEAWHRRAAGNRCWLYYNQPLGHSRFLAVVYACSQKDATLGSIRRALAVLDQIAEIKGTDAMLCDVVGSEISERLLARWGWEPHAASRWHRNYIKRFYGQYGTIEDGRIVARGSRIAEHSADRMLSLHPQS